MSEILTSKERRYTSPGTITWRVVASVLGGLLVVGGTSWMTQTNSEIANLKISQIAIGREVSEIKTAVNSLVSTTESRLAQLENNLNVLSRDVSGLSVGLKAQEKVQAEITISLRELRDDVKVLLRERK